MIAEQWLYTAPIKFIITANKITLTHLFLRLVAYLFYILMLTF